MFKIVKRYYEQNHYNKGDVAKFVIAKKITPEQYREITGEEYVAA